MSARIILGVLSFCMFLVTQMIRASLYIAILEMKENNNTNITSNTPQWTSKERGLVLGGFYWSYWITELPGGLLAHRYGGRTVLGIGVFLSGLAALILPTACSFHAIAAAFVRAVQGLALGVTWPAMHCLSANWIPKQDRGKFMTTYHGAAIGSALTFPLGGVIVSQLGWSYALSLPGVLCLIWSIFWWIFVYDSPFVHPRISDKEKNYLQEALKDVPMHKKSPQPPWKSILTSAPFWAVLFASLGLMWGTLTLSMQLPLYLNHAHKLDTQMAGLLLGIPELCKFFFGLGFSTLMDKLLKQKLISITTVRKISVATCSIVPGFLLLILGWFGDANVYLAMTLLSLSGAVGGASSSGSLANIVDISPTYAGTLLGLIKTLCFLPGVLSPILVSFMVSTKDDSLDGWKVVFGFTASVYIASCLIFQIFGSGEEQPWSVIETSNNVPELSELVKENQSKDNNKVV